MGGGTVGPLLAQIEEDELSPAKILELASRTLSSRCRKLALTPVTVIERNLDLIDMAREEFSTVELLEVCDKLRAPRECDRAMSTKIMNVLEFSAQTQGYINDLSAQAVGYPTGDLVDETYIVNRAAGNSTALLGGN